MLSPCGIEPVARQSSAMTGINRQRYRGHLDLGSNDESASGEVRGNPNGFVVGQSVVGMSRIVDVRNFRNPSMAGQTVSATDFFRADTDSLISGEKGRWKSVHYANHGLADPWKSQGISHEKVIEKLRTIASDTGLGEHIRSISFEKVGSGRQQKYLAVIDLKSECPLEETAIFRKLYESWPHSEIFIPNISIRFDPFHEGGESKAGNPPVSIENLLTAKDGRLEVTGQPNASQQKVLRQWAKKIGARGHRTANPQRLLLALLGSSTDKRTSEGAASLNAMKELNLFAPFWEEMQPAFEEFFEPGQADDFRFFYHGHATLAMSTLLPTLRSFGKPKMHYWLSNASGSAEAREIMRAQRPALMRSQTQEDHLTPMEFVSHLIDHPDEKWDGGPVIVDKGGQWIKEFGINRLRPHGAIACGKIRMVVHNRDDINAMKGAQNVWGVDLANSLTKKLEARILGEQFALIGARQVRLSLNEKISDVPVVIKGFGLLGEQLARAMARLGMKRSNIRIEDSDPARITAAIKLGFGVVAPENRPKKAMVFIATPGLGLTSQGAGAYADESVVVALTSGGKGIDFRSAKFDSERSYEASAKALEDRLYDVVANADYAPCKVHLASEGFAPNLASPMWHDRFQVTSLGVSAAFLQATKLDKPGVDPLDRKLDRAVVRAAHRAGVFEVRALEPREGETQAELEADLEAFGGK